MIENLTALLESWGVNKAAGQVEFLLAPGNIPFAIWETVYVTLLGTLFAYLIGLPLGIILVTGEEGGIRPLPKPLMKVLNMVVNLLRSVPFTILMVVCFPLARLILGTSVGTTASIVPLTLAAAPFVGRVVESSLREMDRGVVEAAQAMGCSPWQIVTKVMLPECRPSLITGFTTATITILSYGGAVCGRPVPGDPGADHPIHRHGAGGKDRPADQYQHNKKEEKITMKRRIAVLALALTLVLSLAACGSKGGDKTITVGASPAPHAEILEVAKEVLAKEGYTLEIKEFDDYVLPNEAVEDGSLDANFFQHITYMNDFNSSSGTHLVSAATIHYEPFGIYAGKTASLDALADGAQIAIPNDATNGGRALLLLQENGLITLKADCGLEPTVQDIVENPHSYEIVELEARLLPTTLKDVDVAVINGNYAIDAGLKIADALAIESTEGTAAEAYANVLTVKEGSESSDGVKALVAALQSEEVKTFIQESYSGAVVPLF